MATAKRRQQPEYVFVETTEKIDEPVKEEKKPFVAKQKFVINNDFSKVYQVGDVVSGLGEEKQNKLIEKGLIE